MNEKIRVVNTVITEKLLNLIAVKAKVAAHAKTDTKAPFLNEIQHFFKKGVFFSGFSAISAYTTTPSVANALSHSDISNTDVGLHATIILTDMTREVSASAFRSKRNKTLVIMSINPDLSTDALNPVNAI